MTPQQIDLIRASFALLQPRLPELGGEFYARLFATAPQLRPMFPREISRQAHALAAMLELIVKMIDMQDKLVPLIRYLGERHRVLKVRPEHYPPFTAALLWTLQRTLGDEFTPETREAWQAAFDFMAEHMK